MHHLFVRRENLETEVLQDALLCLHRQLLTDEVSHILILHIDDGILRQRVVLHVHNLHADFTTCQLLCQHRSTLDGINLTSRVDASLETEAGICLESVTTGTLADPGRVEVSTLEEHILRSLIRTTTLSAKHTGDTHGLLRIADGQILVAQLVLLTVEGHERRAFRQGLHHHFVALHHVCIKAMQWLTICHHDVVGDIDDVVDRTLTNRRQSVLQPFRTFLHLTVLHRHSAVTGTSLACLHFNVKLQVVRLHLEVIHRWTMQRRLITVLLQISIEVTRHTPVRTSVRVVRRDVHLNHIVALQTVVLSGRRTHHSILWQHDDAVMTRAHTNLILGTDHAVRLDATQLALLDDKLLVAVIQLAAQLSHNHLLTGSHVRCAADNLLHHAVALIHRRHVHVVTIRMRLARQHLTDHQTLQSALDALHLFHSLDLQAHAGERLAHLLSCHVEVNIFLQPFV